MAKEAEKTDAKTPADTGKAGAERQPARVQVQVEDSQAITTYANFCRVTGTPEELIIDVGLNSQPVGPQTEPIRINQRLVLNYFTAKRLLAALQMSMMLPPDFMVSATITAGCVVCGSPKRQMIWRGST